MIDRKELLAWADQKIANAGGEADWRAATSRAYYSVYHGCLEAIAQPGMSVISPQSGGSHEAVYGAMRGLTPARCSSHVNHMTIRRIGVMASSLLKPYRVHADYYLNEPYHGEEFTEGKAADCLAKAKHLTQMIDSCMN